jgi:hypothetical protein
MTMTMTDWLILPYDGSAVARATLRRAAAAIRREDREHAGVLLAVAGIEPEGLDGLLREAGAIAGADIALQAHLLHPGDPLGSLRSLLAELPATAAAPVDPDGAAPWCVAAWRLDGPERMKMVFLLTPQEVHAAAQDGLSSDGGGRALGTQHRPRTQQDRSVQAVPGSDVRAMAWRTSQRWPDLSWAILLLAGLCVATLGALAVDMIVQSPAAASWVYLLVVLPVALRWGRAVGVVTATVAAGLLLILLVEPRFSITVADEREASHVLMSLGGMIGAALLVRTRTDTP